MPQYVPIPPGEIDNFDDMLLYLLRELREISKSFEGVEAIILEKMYVEPEKRVDGMVVYADGVEWNPGSGVGVYRWNGSAWVFLG